MQLSTAILTFLPPQESATFGYHPLSRRRNNQITYLTVHNTNSIIV